MHHAIEVVNLGEYADPRAIVKLAQVAEVAGWEGLFVWDHLGFVWNAPAADPWITLAAVANVTTHLTLGTAVSPLPRYRPHVLAQMLTTLDILSQGRVVLGVGLGGMPQEYTAFGESGDPKVQAALLDEGLEVLNQLWSGEAVHHHGSHYTISDVTLTPLPVQRPRIPIWIGGESKPAMRRAARWDGWVISGVSEHGGMTKTPKQMAAQIDTIRQHRSSSTPFEVALTGSSTQAEASLVHEFEAVGVTWWLESLHSSRGSQEEMLARIAAGPAW